MKMPFLRQRSRALTQFQVSKVFLQLIKPLPSRFSLIIILLLLCFSTAGAPVVITAWGVSIHYIHPPNWISPCLSLAPYGSLWLPLWLSLALTATLWHTLALSGSLLLSYFAYTALDRLTGPLLGSQRRCHDDALSLALSTSMAVIIPLLALNCLHSL